MRRGRFYSRRVTENWKTNTRRNLETRWKASAANYGAGYRKRDGGRREPLKNGRGRRTVASRALPLIQEGPAWGRQLEDQHVDYR